MKKFMMIAITVFTLFACGCTFREKFSVTVFDKEEILLKKEYSFSGADALRLRFVGGRIGNFAERFNGAGDMIQKTLPSLYADVEEICKRKSYAPHEPTVCYEGDGKFAYTEGGPGCVASPDEVATQLVEGKGRAYLVLHPLFPLLTVEDLKKRTEKLSSFATFYETSSDSRKHNIALSAQKLDNAVIAPHALLSFNERVGKRTEENGFLSATVIQNGVYTDGVGGGVCQVSTTLYNCWCMAGQAVSESKNHSLPVSYVPKGMDAMVSNYSDLVLSNAGGYPLYLDASWDGKKVQFDLYGKKTEGKIKIWSDGEGERYITYRLFYGGTEERKEILRISEYKSINPLFAGNNGSITLKPGGQR